MGDVVEQVRRGRTARDMTYSMLVLLVPVALMVALYRFLGGEAPTVVDPSGTYSDAAARAGWQVVQPRPVPAGWRATSAGTAEEHGALTLRVGYLGPSGAYAQLTESGGAADTVLTDALGSGPRPAGTADVGGQTWQEYTAKDGERALVLLTPRRTLVLAGRATNSQLESFAAALQS